MRKAYVLIYSEATGGREAMRNWANQEPSVLHWRYDMPNSFYLISEASAADLSASLTSFIGKKGRHLIMEVSDNRQGILPKDTWYLLRNKARRPPEG